ncbi:zinc finger protein 318-like [Python bivittatus]|uniref:Zinc finger protein 318-like n=1 Tax=Python bivittatus TaxID=176946 RepID=A0A9F5IGI5_PYTBI|nr:zinc finger protein 318-like [Python bivittatus]
MYSPGSGPSAMKVQRPKESSRPGGAQRRSRSPSPWSRHHRSPPSRRSSHRSRRSPSPRRCSRSFLRLTASERICLSKVEGPDLTTIGKEKRYSLDQPSYSLRRHSRSPGRRSESSVKKYLRILAENDQYGIGTPDRKILSDRLSSPADSLSDVDRDDLADGPIFSRVLSHPWNLERGFSREENPSSPFSMRHDEDYYSRDIFISQLDRSTNNEHLQYQSRENDRDGERESKSFQYDRDDRLFDESIKRQDLLAETQKYCKQSLNRSPRLMYLDEDFRKLERIRRKREVDELSRNVSTDYPMLDSTSPEQSSESRYHYRSEKTPAMPTKSILKKRLDDSSIQDSGNFLKEKEPHESTSEYINQHGDFLLPHERASQDGSGFSCILGTMTDSTYQEKRLYPFPDNIEDEDKFLYGDDDGDSNNCLYSQKLMLSGKKELVGEKVNSPPPASLSVKPDTVEESRSEYEKIRDLLKTIGLDIGVAEIGKLAARTEERLHGKKTAYSPDHHSVAIHKAETWERHCRLSDVHSPESRQKHSLSPAGSFPSSKTVSPVLKSEPNNISALGQNNPTGVSEQPGVSGFLIPSAPPSFLDIPSGPISDSWHDVPYFSTFAPTQLAPNCAPLPVASPGYDVYQHYMGYATSDWCAQQVKPVCSNKPGLVKLKRKCTKPNLRIIPTVAISKKTSKIKKNEAVSTTALYSHLLPQLSQPSLKDTKGRISDERNRTSQKQKVIEEREKLKLEQELQQKKLYYQRIELNRLSKQQVEMLRKKRKEEDPLLVELSRLKENIAKEVAQLEMNVKAVKEKQSELDKVAHILGMNVFEKSQKLSSENKDSSENNL